MSRMFHGLNELAKAFVEVAELEIAARHVLAGTAAHILHEHVVETFGDATKLAPLAQATQDDRTAKGYSANEPLYRDGALLKSKIEMGHEGTSGGVGSPEPVQRDHEFGYINARTGNSVPPRPVFRIAMEESAPKILAVVESTLPVMFGGKGGSVEFKP